MGEIERQTAAPPAETIAEVATNQTAMQRLEEYARAWTSAAMIAEGLAKTDFAGPFKNKPQDMAVAILKGASLGIPPESIGKSIYVVHGTPALYGKTALAIALQHGYTTETLVDTPEEVSVEMTSPTGETMTVTYTIERAEREGLVKANSAQYKTRPSKMLYWKCIGELTDRMIPHLTAGMPVKEDWEQSDSIKMQATRLDKPKGKGKLEAAKRRKRKPVESPVVPDNVSPEAAKLLTQAADADTDGRRQLWRDADSLPDNEREYVRAQIEHMGESDANAND